MDETITYATEITLDVAVGDAWSAVATPGGLQSWLAPEVALPAVVAGAAGRLVDDDGIARVVSVQRVDEGRSVTFTWWREDDPAEASTVTLLLAPAGEGITRLRVEETMAVQGLRASARAAAAPAAWLGCLAQLGLTLLPGRARG